MTKLVIWHFTFLTNEGFRCFPQDVFLHLHLKTYPKHPSWQPPPLQVLHATTPSTHHVNFHLSRSCMQQPQAPIMTTSTSPGLACNNPKHPSWQLPPLQVLHATTPSTHHDNFHLSRSCMQQPQAPITTTSTSPGLACNNPKHPSRQLPPPQVLHATTPNAGHASIRKLLSSRKQLNLPGLQWVQNIKDSWCVNLKSGL